MDPIYGRSGSVVGWLRNDSVHDLDGRYRVFIDGDKLYSWRNGAHVGWMEDGWLWDSRMQAVGFIAEASGGPAKPGRGGRPGTPGLPGRPGKPGKSGAHGRPGKSNSWSSSSWEEWAPSAV